MKWRTISEIGKRPATTGAAREEIPLAADHYEKLAKHASDCIACGHCDSRCPFHVQQTRRMEEIAAYFGK